MVAKDWEKVLKTVNPNVKKSTIVGCETFSDRNEFAVKLKKDMPDLEVNAAVGNVQIAVDPQANGTIDVTFTGKLETVTRTNVELMDQGMPQPNIDEGRPPPP